MKKNLILLILFISLINITNLSATTGTLKSATIIECDGILFGAHGNDNHYHRAEQTLDGKFQAKGDSLGSDWVCKGQLINLNETIELEKVEAKFESCVDGDTAVFNIDGQSEKFRFLAIDTPETKHPTKKEEPFGKEASEYTCNKLKSAKKIEIEYEKEKTDKYDRSLGWIWIDNSLLQQELISEGLAKVAYIYGNYKYTSNLCELQNYAIKNELGIWKEQKNTEGYCDTLKTDLDAKEADINEDLPKSENNKKYTKETLIGGTLLLLAIFIKALKK